MKYLLWAAVTLVTLITACKKDNKAGVAVISTTAATNITANSAQLGGDITNTSGSTITQSGICWTMQGLPTVADSVINSGQTGTGSFTSSMDNLYSNTTYYVRAFAINGVGTAYGVVDSFVTAKGVPAVVTTAIGNNQALTAQSGGTVSNSGGAAITARGVVWSTSANPTTANSKTVDSLGTGPTIDTLTNLTLGATYYVRAYATNSYGTGYGNQVTFTVSTTGTVTDFDGNVYGTITIGTQTWMTSNLRVTHYQNGDPITNGLSGFDFTDTTSPHVGAYTFANGDISTDALFGKYYNAFSIFDSRNIAPQGWHVPTDQDWYTLEFFEGLTTADTLSNYEDQGFRGTIGGKLMVGGSSALNLQLAGYYCPGCGGFSGFNQYGLYLSSTAYDFQSVFLRFFNLSGPAAIYRTYGSYVGSIRCIKD